jgi:hypothetical protein
VRVYVHKGEYSCVFGSVLCDSQKNTNFVEVNGFHGKSTIILPSNTR